jgi:hypothetical protein
MDRLKSPEGGVLRALERSRSMAFAEAQAERGARAGDLAEKEAAREQLARAREAAYEARRKQIGHGSAFTIQQLHWNHQYALSQLAREKAAEELCEQARQALQQAQDEARRRLEELRVVEKLRDRRRAEFSRSSRRRGLGRLDELGLIKAWHVTTTGEHTWPPSAE